jgi:hypothetical protein
MKQSNTAALITGLFACAAMAPLLAIRLRAHAW